MQIPILLNLSLILMTLINSNTIPIHFIFTSIYPLLDSLVPGPAPASGPWSWLWLLVLALASGFWFWLWLLALDSDSGSGSGPWFWSTWLWLWSRLLVHPPTRTHCPPPTLNTFTTSFDIFMPLSSAPLVSSTGSCCRISIFTFAQLQTSSLAFVHRPINSSSQLVDFTTLLSNRSPHTIIVLNSVLHYTDDS